jgi:Zn-dependent protease with chaperone function
MASAANIPPPALCPLDDRAPNAFATGRDPSRAALAVTSGLLEQLTREELQGVVAHEVAHIRNLDSRYGLFVAVLVGTTVLIADGFFQVVTFPFRLPYRIFRAMADSDVSPGSGRVSGHGSGGGWSFPSIKLSGGGDSKGGGAALILAIIIFVILVIVVSAIVYAIAPIFARLTQASVSREREYLADASAVELGRNPDALERALLRIASSRGCSRSPTGRPRRSTSSPDPGVREACLGDLVDPSTDDRPDQPIAGTAGRTGPRVGGGTGGHGGDRGRRGLTGSGADRSAQPPPGASQPASAVRDEEGQHLDADDQGQPGREVGRDPVDELCDLGRLAHREREVRHDLLEATLVGGVLRKARLDGAGEGAKRGGRLGLEVDRRREGRDPGQAHLEWPVCAGDGGDRFEDVRPQLGWRHERIEDRHVCRHTERGRRIVGQPPCPHQPLRLRDLDDEGRLAAGGGANAHDRCASVKPASAASRSSMRLPNGSLT